MRRFIAPFLLLTLLISAAVLPGTAATATRASTSSSRGVAPSDSQIEATLRGKLAKSKIGKDGFKFHVQHGVVTWDGTTAVMQHKGSATRMARTAGALQVINNIQVSGAARAKAAANLKKAKVSD